MKRVLVTGARGFVGQHVIPYLAKKNYEIHVIQHQRSLSQNSDIIIHQADLFQPDTIKEILQKISASHLLHIAWYAEHGDYWNSPLNYDWLIASLQLAKSFVEYGGKRVVVAGTCAEYDWQYQKLIENNTPCFGNSPYATCKLSLLKVLESFSQLHKISFAWGRLFYLFGPGEDSRRLVPSVISALLKDQTFVCDHPEDVRDFIYVRDAADALVELLDSEVQGPVNIASGKGIKLHELLINIASIMDKRHLLNSSDTVEGNEIVADISRLTNEVKWHSGRNLKESLNETIDWWKNLQ
ncbi:MAG: NAD-dependent epimerase/dehydratase family protein [Candidatus Dadabacteria bacterium]|nr:NAD-dependent epimerase/dehydratase family protein [Candidatus Dadabacteria bacterium]